MQLELFPRKEFNSLVDFQRLENNQLELEDRKLLVRHPSFFQSPKTNLVIRRQHSQMVDKIIGMRQKYIEEMLVAEARGFEPEGSHESWGPVLHDGVQTWVGLDIETLQTPYADCLRILQLLKIKPFQHVIDLGAAYGRMGVVIGGLYIKNSFTGYEYVKARVDEGNRVYKELGFSKCELKTQNLFAPDFDLPVADIYFIYDYGHVEHIDHTLKQIERIAHQRPIKVVVHGRFTKEIINSHHQWLSPLYEGKWDDKVSIYSAFIV